MRKADLTRQALTQSQTDNGEKRLDQTVLVQFVPVAHRFKGLSTLRTDCRSCWRARHKGAA